MSPPETVLLIDADERRDLLARRLRSQGFLVEVHADPAAGANAALAAPPHVVVADLWMPGISGVQLTRLLKAEPATMDVPVVLRATTDEPRNRFWARHAGARGYVPKGRIGELVRALRRVIVASRDDFFMQLGPAVDVRDRISAHLDRALFESVLASELRALGAVGSFDRLLDLFSQLLSQITAYRWVAVSTGSGRIGVHCRPEDAQQAIVEAREVLAAGAEAGARVVEDDDAEGGPLCRPALRADIAFGGTRLGAVALSPSARSDADPSLVELVARELAGPLRIIALVEETQRLATTDTLTGLMRRPPFVAALQAWASRPEGVAVLLVDLDRFKAINDRHGHATGDRVLEATGAVLARLSAAAGGAAGRWGGEEFVVGLPLGVHERALRLGEAIRAGVEAIDLAAGGVQVPVTSSIGVAVGRPSDTIESLVHRADMALYRAKEGGRNRVVGEDDDLGVGSLGA